MWAVKCQYESRKIPTGKLRHRGLDLRRYTSGLDTYPRAVTVYYTGDNEIRKMGVIVKKRILRERAEGKT